MGLMSERKRKAGGGRPPLPEGEHRARYALRLPQDLLAQFRGATADKPRGEATRVIEQAIRKYVQKHRRRTHDS